MNDLSLKSLRLALRKVDQEIHEKSSQLKSISGANAEVLRQQIYKLTLKAKKISESINAIEKENTQ